MNHSHQVMLACVATLAVVIIQYTYVTSNMYGVCMDVCLMSATCASMQSEPNLVCKPPRHLEGPSLPRTQLNHCPVLQNVVQVVALHTPDELL